jgi:type IV secretory pathway protease TraF
VLGALVLAAMVSTRWVRLNLSPSVPLGFYRLERRMTPLTRGTLVVLPAPTRIRPWWPWPHPALLKPVAAVAGEAVCSVGGELFIHGVWYGPIFVEAQGKPLPHIDGCQIVPAGAVFLASPQPRSLDGRYFGMTPMTTLTARAVPLLLWGN